MTFVAQRRTLGKRLGQIIQLSHPTKHVFKQKEFRDIRFNFLEGIVDKQECAKETKLLFVSFQLTSPLPALVSSIRGKHDTI